MKKEFIVNRQGKDFVLYAGLLDQAHGEGLKRITTTLLQAPSAANGHMAICWAEVETSKGTFSGIGDASPDNVGRMIALHCVRMAETRAKARALRDAINVGVTAFEELGDLDDDQHHAHGTTQRQVEPPAPGGARPITPTTTPPPARQPVASLDVPRVTDQQKQEIHRLLAAFGKTPLTIPDDWAASYAQQRIDDLTRQLTARDAVATLAPKGSDPASDALLQRIFTLADTLEIVVETEGLTTAQAADLYNRLTRDQKQRAATRS